MTTNLRKLVTPTEFQGYRKHALKVPSYSFSLRNHKLFTQDFNLISQNKSVNKTCQFSDVTNYCSRGRRKARSLDVALLTETEDSPGSFHTSRNQPTTIDESLSAVMYYDAISRRNSLPRPRSPRKKELGYL